MVTSLSAMDSAVCIQWNWQGFTILQGKWRFENRHKRV